MSSTPLTAHVASYAHVTYTMDPTSVSEPLFSVSDGRFWPDSPATAPRELEFAPVADVMHRLWGWTFANSLTGTEQAVMLATTRDDNVVALNATMGLAGAPGQPSLSVDINWKLPSNMLPLGPVHTHNDGLPLSAGDLADLVNYGGPMMGETRGYAVMVVHAGNAQYLALRTKATVDEVDPVALEKRVRQVADEVAHALDERETAYRQDHPELGPLPKYDTLVQRPDARLIYLAANLVVADELGLALYASNGTSLFRRLPFDESVMGTLDALGALDVLTLSPLQDYQGEGVPLGQGFPYPQGPILWDEPISDIPWNESRVKNPWDPPGPPSSA